MFRFILFAFICLQQITESSQIESQIQIIHFTTGKPGIPTECKAGNITHDNSTNLYSVNGLSLIDSDRGGKNRSYLSKPDEYNCFINGYTGKWPDHAVCDFGSISFEFSEDLIFGTIKNFARYERLRKEFRLFDYRIKDEWNTYWLRSSARKNMEEYFAKKFDKLPFIYQKKDLYKFFG